MPLFNMRLNRWYGWDGKSDTLWGQSIAPILDKRELGLTPAALKSRITESPELNRGYGQVFGAAAATHDPETVHGFWIMSGGSGTENLTVPAI